MSKIKNGGLDQYGAEPFEQQQFGTVGVEGVNRMEQVEWMSGGLDVEQTVEQHLIVWSACD